MLKQLTAILLLLAMLGQTFSRYALELDYQCNKAYIAKYLCENRDKPEMKCAGKCYLCKRLKKEDKKDQDNPTRRLDNKAAFMSAQQDYAMNHPLCMAIPVRYSPFNQFIPHPFLKGCFHPPQG